MLEDPRAAITHFAIAPDKLTRYLLDLDNPDGAAKAARFLRHRFEAATLGVALQEHGKHGAIVATNRTE